LHLCTHISFLPPPREKESDAGSEVSEWELREQGEQCRVEAGVLGAGKESPLFLPTPPFMASAGD